MALNIKPSKVAYERETYGGAVSITYSVSSDKTVHCNFCDGDFPTTPKKWYLKGKGGVYEIIEHGDTVLGENGLTKERVLETFKGKKKGAYQEMINLIVGNLDRGSYAKKKPLKEGLEAIFFN